MIYLALEGGLYGGDLPGWDGHTAGVEERVALGGTKFILARIGQVSD